MEVLFYVAIVSCIISAFGQEGVEINLIKKFSINFLKYVQWSKIIMLTDDRDFVYLSKYLSQHMISAKVASVNEFELNELNNFGSVLIISKTNTATAIVKKALKLSYCPSNWLLILEEKFESFGNFFIPHDIGLFLLDVGHSHEVWLLFRLYSANGNVIKPRKCGFWNPKNGDLKFLRFSVLLPSYSENALRLSSIPFQPFFSVQKEKEKLTVGGLHGEILKVIQSVFFFNTSVDIPDDKAFGTVVNSSHVSGIVGKLYRNESDVGISLTKTRERMELISFSLEITKMHAKIMYHNMDRAEERFFFYLEPFSSYSWICIIGFTVLFAVLLSIVSFIKNNAKRRPKKAIGYVHTIFYYARSALHILLKTGLSVHVYGLSGRICLLVFHIFCIIMFTGYCSSLTSILAVTRIKLPFNSFYEFIYKSNYDLAALKHTSIVQILKVSKEDLYARAYKKFSSKPDKFMVNSNKEGKDLVYNRKIAFLMEELTLATEVDKNCSFRFLDEVILEADFCFTFNNQFPYKQLFNKYIRILLENGVYQKHYRDFNQEDHNAYCDRMRKGIAATSVKVSAVVGLFFPLCLGIGIALTMFVIEVLYNYYSDNK